MRAPTKTSISTNLDQFLSTMIYSVRWHSFKISLIRISIFSVVAVPCRDQFKSFLLIRKLWKSFKIFLFDLNFWIMDQSAEFYWKIIQTTHHKIDIPLIFLHHFIQMWMRGDNYVQWFPGFNHKLSATMSVICTICDFILILLSPAFEATGIISSFIFIYNYWYYNQEKDTEATNIDSCWWPK